MVVACGSHVQSAKLIKRSPSAPLPTFGFQLGYVLLRPWMGGTQVQTHGNGSCIQNASMSPGKFWPRFPSVESQFWSDDKLITWGTSTYLGFTLARSFVLCNAWKLNWNGWKWILHLKTRSKVHAWLNENRNLGHWTSVVANHTTVVIFHSGSETSTLKAQTCQNAYHVIQWFKLKTWETNEPWFWISLDFHICVFNCALHPSHVYRIIRLINHLKQHNHKLLAHN